jgi:hypothetical protein
VGEGGRASPFFTRELWARSQALSTSSVSVSSDSNWKYVPRTISFSQAGAIALHRNDAPHAGQPVVLQQLDQSPPAVGGGGGRVGAGEDQHPARHELRARGRAFRRRPLLAGMSTKLGTQRLRRVLLGFGLVIFVGTVGWIATFPVSISI